jgi:hypothetical protein
MPRLKKLKPDREPFAACGLYRLGGANSFFPGVRANARISSTAEANDEQQFSRFCIVEPARLIRRRQFAGFFALGLSEFTFAVREQRSRYALRTRRRTSAAARESPHERATLRAAMILFESSR